MGNRPRGIFPYIGVFILALLLIFPGAAAPPVSDFSGTPVSGRTPLSVAFTDISSGIPTGWAWYFGDENYTQPWTVVNASAGWTPRYYHTSVVTPDGTIVLMGGWDGGSLTNDTWLSDDSGKTWTLVNASPGWSARSSQSSVVLADGSILLTGGQDSRSYQNDVWRSSDNGMTWNLVNGSAGWPARSFHSTVVMHDGSIVLLGGSDGSHRLNDVWRSTDNGMTWTLVNASSAWSARYRHSVVSLPDDRIILFGGYDTDNLMNDVWRSTDYGASWTRVTADAGWHPRNGQSSMAMPDGTILMLGGSNLTSSMNDVWISADLGTSWHLVNASSGWSARTDQTLVMLPDGSLVLMGGYDGSYKNDVWRFQPAGSSLQNPVHIYTTPGTYSVALQSRNSGGFNSTRKTGYVTATVNRPPVASGVLLSSSSGLNRTSDNLTLSWTVADPDGDPVRNITSWYVNGNPVTRLNMPFAGGSNSTYTKDYSGSGNHGAVAGAVWNATNGHDGGGAYSFSGTQYVSVPDSSSLDINGTALSIEAWIYPAALTNYMAIAGKEANSYAEPYWVYQLEGTSSGVSFRLSTNGAARTWVDSSALTAGRWYHIVGTYNGSYMNLYVNGELNNSAAKTGNVTTSTGKFSIGRFQNGNKDNFAGRIDTVRVYNRALSSQQVEALYHNRNDLIAGPELKSGDSWLGSVTPNDGITDGATVVSNSVTITGSPSAASFSEDTTSGTAPLAVQFTDTTPGTATAWNWDFGDGNTTGSTLQNPEHLYVKPGMYTVSLNVTNTGGYGTVTKSRRILVNFRNASLFHNDMQHTGVYDAGGTVPTGAVKWTYTAGDLAESSPAVADGIVYIGSNDNKLNALFAVNGTKLWEYTTGGHVYSSPAVADGMVYAGSQDGNVYGIFASNGTLRWTFPTGSFAADSSPTPAYGYVFAGAADHKLHALSAGTGTELWNITTGDVVSYSPAVDKEMVYVASGDNVLYAVFAGNGTVRWTYTDGDPISTSPAVYGSNIYFGSQNGNVTALYAGNGTEKWHYRAGGGIMSTPAISDGRLFAGGLDKNLYSLNAGDGTKIWNISTGSMILSSPAVANGIVYFANDDHIYSVFAANGTPVWNYTFTGGMSGISSSPAVANGTVFIGGPDNKIYAFGGTLLPPLASFSANVTYGTAPLTVQFTDASTGSPTAWNWSFGDGQYSEIQNVSHTYTTPGTYTVSLNSSNAGGYNVSTRTGYIRVTIPRPVTSFTTNITAGTVPLTVQFADSSSNTPTGWAWYFGDEIYNQTWAQVNASAGWETRYGHTSIVTPDGSIVLMGGWNSGVYYNDTWKSVDAGATWSPVSSSSGWETRSGHTSVVTPDGTILLMGGENNNIGTNDTWRSSDRGATWTRINASSGWPARWAHTSVLLSDGSIVLMGGYDGKSYLNDVWRSTDQGVTWTEVNPDSAWARRLSFSSVALPDNSIVLSGGCDLGGYFNDVWRSTDFGATWTRVNASAGWEVRSGHSMVVTPDHSIILTGGWDGSSKWNDVWRSTDNGATWTKVNASPGWVGRFHHSSVVVPDGEIVLTGGFTGTWAAPGLKNDVWRFQPAGSSLRNPEHTYTSAGNYTVALQSYNAGGFNSTRQAGSIRVTTPPVTGPVLNLNTSFGYPTIMTAVGNATPGDTLVVGSGIYPENINIVRRLALVGNDTGSGLPVIDPGTPGVDTGIAIDADDVVLDGFIVRNTRDGVYVTGSNATIRNLTATGNNFGITLDGSGRDTITLSNISGNVYDGITGLSARNSTISSSIVDRNRGAGIVIREGSRNITIMDVLVRNNNEYGIAIHGSSNNTVQDNVLLSNDKGIVLEMTAGNTLRRNNASNSTWEGMLLDSAAENLIADNRAYGNHDNGFTLVNGSRLNRINGNEALRNAAAGMYMENSGSNTLAANDLHHNDNGISANNVSSSSFTGNNASFNTDYGVLIRYGSSANTFTGTVATWNGIAGIDNDLSPGNRFSTSRLVSNSAGIIVSQESDGTQITGTTAVNNSDGGIQIEGSSGCTVSENQATNGGNGLSIHNGSALSVFNNVFTGNTDYGIILYTGCRGNTFTNNNASANGIGGVNVGNSSDNIISKSRMDSNSYGVMLSDLSYNNTFAANVLTGNNGNAFDIQGSRNTTITDNEIVFNSPWYPGAIRLTESANSLIADNRLRSNYEAGIQIRDNSTANIVRNNTIDNHTVGGILVSSASFNEFSANTISGTDYGLKLDNARSNIFSRNLIRNNSHGAGLSGSTANVLFDNLFNNSVNVVDDGTNTWNQTRRAGTNILGGAFIGGNAWSSYAGRDTDGDGIGDTLLPYAGGIATGGDWLPLTNLTGSPVPVAGFTSTPEYGLAPLTVQFNDTSTGSPTAWLWDFGDGSSTNSTVRDPVHTYSAIGSHTVSLRVTNGAGSNTTTSPDFIHVSDLRANFTWSCNATVPYRVDFRNTSTTSFPPLESLWWDFGDGATDLPDSASPMHTYADATPVTVNLQVWDGMMGGDSVNRTVIPCGWVLPSAGFTALPVNGTIPLAVQFTDTSGGSPTEWEWDFGDGSGSTARNPLHKYTQAGTYTVTLNATGAGGSSRVTRPALILADFGSVTQFRNDRRHTGIFDDGGITTTPNLKWNISTGASVGSSPVISGGILYIGSDDGKVYAVNATTGSPVWNASAGFNLESAPAVADGVLYIGSWDSNVYAFNATTGTPVWTHPTGAFITSSPAVANGMVYIGSHDGILYALNASTGIPFWTYTTGSASIESTPALSDGILYFGSAGQKVHAVNTTTGIALWNTSTAGDVISSPAVSGGRVYVGSNNDRLYALNAATGAILWQFATGGNVLSSPAVSGGVVYAGCDDANLYAVDAATGTKLWNFTTGNAVVSSPAVAGGSVYAGSNDKNLYALNATTGSPVWNFSAESGISSSPAVWQGMVFFGSDDHSVYALGGSPALPVPAFSGTPVTGTVPLTVTFTDLSANGPLIWNWSFGDGNFSTARNPSHTYGAAGNYTVSLTASNAAGSNVTTRAGYINARPVPAPVVDFSMSPSEGTVPLSVQFTDISEGSPAAWNWSFGDGSYSDTQNPVHTFTEPMVTNVTLKAWFLSGLSNSTMRQVTGNAVQVSTSTSIEGTSTAVVNNTPVLTVNTTAVEESGGTVTTTNTSVTITGANEFWHTTQVFAENVTVNETTMEYTATNTTEVILQSTPVIAVLNQTIGTVSVALDVALKQYVPDADVNITITQGATTSTESAFQLAASNANITIQDIAYTVQLTNTEGINTNLTQNATRRAQAAVLNMSVSHAWVARFRNSTNNDGRDSIAIIRYPENGAPRVLPTRFVAWDPQTNLDWYIGDSSEGFSIFGMIGFAAQEAAASQQGASQPPSNSNSYSPSSDSSPDTGSKDPSAQKSAPPPVDARAQKAPASMPVAVSLEKATLATDKTGHLAAAVQVQSADKAAALTLPADVAATDKSGQPLAEVSIRPDTTAQPLGDSAQFTYGGIAYNCGPEGARFSPAIAITFTLTKEQWDSLTANGKEPVVRSFSPATGVWETLPTTADPASLTISADVSHFSSIAVFSRPAQKSPPAAASVTGGPAAASSPAVPVPKPTKPPANALEIMINMGSWLTKNLFILAVLILLIPAGYVGIRWYRKKKQYDSIIYGRRR